MNALLPFVGLCDGFDDDDLVVLFDGGRYGECRGEKEEGTRVLLVLASMLFTVHGAQRLERENGAS